METARALLSPEFGPVLRQELESGCSFPVARQRALNRLGVSSTLLENPNDILAVEYCKAILAQGSSMRLLPIQRQGNYHDTQADAENPSATALRRLIEQNENWSSFVPAPAQTVFHNASIHTLVSGERAILARLRTMSDNDFAALPYGSEGLWRKLMRASRSHATLEDILTAAKSKRYTRTRLDRMAMCAYLGITEEILDSTVPYVRVLGLRTSGISTLKKARQTGLVPHTGEKIDHPYQALEQRWDDMYGLFRFDAPSPAGMEHERRIYLLK